MPVVFVKNVSAIELRVIDTAFKLRSSRCLAKYHNNPDHKTYKSTSFPTDEDLMTPIGQKAITIKSSNGINLFSKKQVVYFHKNIKTKRLQTNEKVWIMTLKSVLSKNEINLAASANNV